MTPPTLNVIDRLLDPLAACLTPEVADRIVHFRPDAGVEQRLEVLREKANEGQLTAEERNEYAEYVDALDFVALFKAKAQSVLERRAD